MRVIPGSLSRAMAAGLCALGLLGLSSSAAGPKETPVYQAPAPLTLPDGSSIVLTQDAVERRLDGRALWTCPSDRPAMPLLFQAPSGEEALLVYDQVSYDEENWARASFRALNVADGSQLWRHTFFGSDLSVGASYTPHSPLVFKGKLFYARSCWLEAIDPATGILAERHWAVEAIRSLRQVSDESLELTLKLGLDAGGPTFTQTFIGGRFAKPLRAASNGIPQLGLMRAAGVVPKFEGTGKADRFSGYLDLHAFKRAPLPEELRRSFENFDLGAVERAYSEAYRQDPLNPYLGLNLALCLHYQGREAEAEAWFQKALSGSSVSWHEPFWMGGECERVGLSRWADALYERGFQAYFAALPAPGSAASLLEVLIHFRSQRISSALFYNGHVERALEIVRLRRRLFPFTEGDGLYHPYKVEWLRERGDEAALAEEEAWARSAERENALAGLYLPGWFQGWAGFLLASWGLFALLAGRALFRRSNLLPVLLVLILGLSLLSLATQRREITAAGLAGLACAVAALFAVSWLGARRERDRVYAPTSPGPPPPLAEVLSQSSPLYLAALCGLGAVAAYLTRLPAAATFAMALLLVGLALYRRWGRSRLRARGCEVSTLSGGHIASLAASYLAAWGVTAVLSYHVALIGVSSAWTLPFVDFGHPRWVERLHAREGQLWIHTRDIRFAVALSEHLSGDEAGASKRYAELPDDARALNNLGVLVFQAERPRAEALFREALEADPGCPAALYNLALLTGDEALVKRASESDAWRVDVHRRYKPGQPMVAVLPMDALARAMLWDRETVFALLSPTTRFLQGFALAGAV